MGKNPNTSCSQCNSPIYKKPNEIKKYNKIFCSKKCQGLSQRKIKYCITCNKEIAVGKNSKNCSRTCSNKARSGMQYKNKGWKKDKAKTNRAIKNYLIELRGGICQCCGYNKTNALVVHHIIFRSQGGTNDEWNLMLICPNCHWEIHSDTEGLALASQALLKSVAVSKAVASSILAPSS